MKELWELYSTWFKMGAFTFGGGYAMLPIITREVVEKHHWATEDEIMDYYAVSQCTPGIIAVNVSTFVGYYQKGIIGALASTLGLVSPCIVIISLIATFLTNFADLPIVQHALAGISIVVCVMMTSALWKLLKSVKSIPLAIIAILAFVFYEFLGIPSMIIVLLAGIAGIFLDSLEKAKEAHHE